LILQNVDNFRGCWRWPDGADRSFQAGVSERTTNRQCV
jgi:hypothetical protein